MGKVLEPLPPIEYCRLDKATRLLKCDLDDLIHWGAIGAISLGVKVSDLYGTLIIDTAVNPRISDMVDVLCDFDLQKDLLGTYSNFFIPFGDYDPLIQDKDDIEKGIYCFEGNANGLWQAPIQTVEKIENFGEAFYKYQIGDITSASISFFPMFNVDDNFKLFQSYPRYDWKITAEDLWITRPDLKLLHECLQSDLELSNRHNRNSQLNETRKKRENDLIKSYTLKTPPDSILASLGVMSCLFAERDGYVWGGRPNAKAIALKIESKAIEVFGVDSDELQLSNLRKDISTAVNFISNKIKPKA